jgi:hypothetical protein
VDIVTYTQMRQMRLRAALAALCLVAAALPLAVAGQGSSNGAGLNDASESSSSSSSSSGDGVLAPESTGAAVARFVAIGFLLVMSGLFSGLTLGLLGLDCNQLLVRMFKHCVARGRGGGAERWRGVGLLPRA